MTAKQRAIEAEDRVRYLVESRERVCIERDELRSKVKQTAKLLIQERSELLVRVQKIDILLYLTGGVEQACSPSFTVTR